jgi:hypothetical protein
MNAGAQSMRAAPCSTLAISAAGWRRVAVAASLVLWAAAIALGRWIAYWYPPVN